jgi:hypothetical protein
MAAANKLQECTPVNHYTFAKRPFRIAMFYIDADTKSGGMFFLTAEQA